MPRVRSNVVRLKRKKQVMKAARGAFGARSKLWKAAKENVERGWKYAYRDRKNKKRDFRRLWIVRINAGAHQHDMSYSVFMNGLRQAGIEIDRKVLSDLAINDPAAFGARSKLWEAAKENVERGWKYAYRDRKNKKRDFRRLWIVRINAGAHQHDMSYSVFMNGLKQAGIEIDRKVLSDLAINDPAAFGALAEKARAALN